MTVLDATSNMAAALPLLTQHPTGPNTGTGFLVSDGEVTWLLTCVHMFSELIVTPPKLDFFLGRTVEVYGAGCSLPLTIGGDQQFNVVNVETAGIDPPITAHLADVIAIRLLPAVAIKLKSFGAFARSAVADVSCGQQICLRGFPGLDQAILANRLPSPTVLHAQVTEVDDLRFALDKPSAPGWSGSPVTSNEALIGIANGDRTQPPTSTTGYRLGPLASALFRPLP